MDTQDQDNVPRAQDRVSEDVAVEEEHQLEEETQEDRIAEEGEHKAEAVRRRTSQPRQMFTYGTLGQPSYQQWDAGVNYLLPRYSLPGHLSTVPLPYLTPPHPYYFNCFTQAY